MTGMAGYEELSVGLRGHGVALSLVTMRCQGIQINMTKRFMQLFAAAQVPAWHISLEP